MGSKSLAMEGHFLLAVRYGVGTGCSSLSMMKGCAHDGANRVVVVERNSQSREMDKITCCVTNTYQLGKFCGI